MAEADFQMYQCGNPLCRFRFANNLSVRTLSKCPLCGADLEPSGQPFSNARLLGQDKGNPPLQKVEVLLDSLRSTLNVGSVFRTAEGAGVSHIHCCGTTPTPEHPKIAKTSLGAEDFLPWTFHPNALDLVQNKKAIGFRVISIEATRTSKDIFTFNSSEKSSPVLLVMGNEVTGVDPEILQLSDDILHIPMSGRKDSLNVAVAFGIAIYTLFH